MPRAPVEPRLPGPFPVGRYAHDLSRYMQDRARVRLIGEAVNVKRSGGGDLYFELRDADGAMPIAMWAKELARMQIDDDAIADGTTVVVAGGLDFYPGSATASPRFSFRASFLRLAGTGDLMARLEELRAKLRDEGLFEPQKLLERPALPRRIGVIAAEDGKARADIVAALERRGWHGTVVYSFQPVQDSRAAPRICRALEELAPEVDVIVVARGGGSLADLWAFCDETLCRTVAALGTPVVSAIGHTTDTVLLDDVAAVACATPTHAAEAVVRVDCNAARAALLRDAGRLAVANARIAALPATLRTQAARIERAGRGSVAGRARHLVALARVPAEVQRQQRATLWQDLRELHASARRRLDESARYHRRIGTVVLTRKAEATALEVERARAALVRAAADLERSARLGAGRRRGDLARSAILLRAHEPERTLERGYALVEDGDGEPVTAAADARSAGSIGIRFADGTVRATVDEESR